MDITKYYAIEGEKPLDVIKPDGGLTAIFRTIACVGDSMSSGAHESCNEEKKHGFHDYFEYSWGQYMARAIGAKVYNFSRNGMTAEEYCRKFADEKGFWDPSLACQAYIVALGVNEAANTHQEIGTIADIDLENPENNNMETFAGCYGKIIQKYRQIEPKSRFFLMTIPKSCNEPPEYAAAVEAHAKVVREIADLFEFTYVLDVRKYAPVCDEKILKDFYLGGHMNAAGYLYTSHVVMSYIDYIIRHNPEDFAQVGFIGKGGVHNAHVKW